METDQPLSSRDKPGSGLKSVWHRIQRFSVSGLGILLVWVIYTFEAGLSAPVTVSIQPGDTGRSVSIRLYRAGVLHHPDLLRLLARISQDDMTNLIPGTYAFGGLISLRVVQDTLSHSAVPISVSIPEGYTAQQIANLLEEEGMVSASELLRAVATMEYPGFARPPSGWEGYLWPDTYEFPESLSAEEIVRKMISRFLSNLPPNWQELAAENRRSLHEIVIVASLVQREALLEEEMPLIAGVIYNRLRKNMALQIDATVAYALNKWGHRISYEDLKVDHPYNTYLRKGLPPGPIGNPGRSALISAFLPARTDYLYFVADGTGAHRFSRTYPEHRTNVEMQRHRRRHDASSPSSSGHRTRAGP